MQPIGDGDFGAVITVLETDAALNGEPLRLYGVDSAHKELLEELYPEKFAFASARSTMDYIYLCSELATLPGRRFQPMRNLINQFKAAHSYSFEAINTTNIDHCKELNSRWCLGKSIDSSDPEQLALQRMFDHFDSLNIEGWILYADAKPSAFTIGSAVGCDTFCIHIEKADATIKGAAAMINTLTAQALQPRYKYINREEDMGIPGLRKAKLSYHPVQLLAKYSALALSDREHQIMELWQRVFGDKRSDIEEFMVQLYSPERTFTLSEEGQIVSMLHIVPLSDSIRKIAYIYAVATAEEYRGRGLATQLITRALEVIDSSDFDCAVLIPSSSSTAHFYEKFGFRYTGYTLDFSTFGIDFDLGTGDSSKDFAIMREKS